MLEPGLNESPSKNRIPLSWFSRDGNEGQQDGGWAVAKAPREDGPNKKGAETNTTTFLSTFIPLTKHNRKSD